MLKTKTLLYIKQLFHNFVMAINSSSVYKINWKLLPSSTWSNICIATVSHGHVYLFMVCVQVLLLAVLQILTVICRKEPTIKAADVIFLHICFTGAYILHIGSVLDILSQIFANFDLVNLLLGVIIIVWLVPIGATLLVSPIISRSWRVYRLFVHSFHPGKCLTSY